MARAKKSFTPQYHDEAVKLVIETSRPIAVVARAGPAAGTGEREPGTAHAQRIPGKSGGLLRPGVSVSSRYEFIDGEKDTYPIVKMCRWARVSRAGYYKWRDRPASATAERRTVLTQQIRQVPLHPQSGRAH